MILAYVLATWASAAVCFVAVAGVAIIAACRHH